MSTAELKYNLFKAIDAIKDSKVLSEIYKLVSKKGTTKKTDWWDDLTPDQKTSIERGIKDIDAGRVYTHEEVIAKSNAFLSQQRKSSK